jgi:WD40 repeat protein
MRKVILLAVAGLVLWTSPAVAGPELVLQTGHTDDVVDADVVQAGEGLVAATLGKDATLKFWDGAGGVLRSFDLPPRERMRFVILGPDGTKALVVHSYKGELQQYDLARGLTGEVKTPIWDAAAVCVTPDHHFAAIAAGNKAVVIVEVPSGKVVAKGSVEDKPTACAWSRDHKTLAIGASNGRVNWLDVDAGLELVDRRGWGAFDVRKMTQHPTKDIWAVTTGAFIQLWDAGARERGHRMIEDGARGYVRWSADGKTLLGSGASGTYSLDLKTGKITRDGKDKTPWRGAALRTHGISPVVGHGGDAAVWDLDARKQLASLSGTRLSASALTALGDGRHIALGTRTGEVQIWNVLTGGRAPGGWQGDKHAVTGLAFSPDGAWAGVAYADGDVELRTGAGKKDRQVSVTTPTHVTFLPDGKTIWVDGYHETKAFNVRTGVQIKVEGYAPGARSLSVSGDVMAYTKYDKPYVSRGGTESKLAVQGKVASVAALGDVVFVARPDGSVARVPLAGGDAQEVGGSAGLRQLVASPGNFVAGVAADGAVRFWTDKSPGVAVTLFVDTQGEWIAWTPSGAFDSSGGGGRHVAWLVQGRAHPLERFRRRYHVPDLLRHVLGPKRGTVKVDALTKAWSPPPAVRIVSPESGDSLGSSKAKVKIEVRDNGGGIEHVRLYHQERLVAEADRKSLSGQTVTLEFPVALVQGENRFVAAADSKGDVESRSAEVTVSRRAGADNARMRILAIGIDAYLDPALRLTSAKRDAEAVAKMFKARGKAVFRGGVTAKVLTDEQATKEGIAAGFAWLARETRPEDVAVVFFAGHGETAHDEYFFIPQDLRYQGDDSLVEQGLSQGALQEMVKAIPARRVIMLLDTCKSGKLTDAFGSRGFKIKKSLTLFSQTTGTYMVAASTAQQLALEDTKLGHGIFTYAVLEGVKGGADYDDDGQVSIRELILYLDSEVARISKEKFNREQYPVAFGTGRNFPLVSTQ